MKKFYLVLAVLALSYFSYAQEPGVKWSKLIETYPASDIFGEILYDIKPAKGKNFIVAGSDSIGTHIEYSRNDIFNKSYGNHLWLSKMDSSGTPIWTEIIYTDRGALVSAVSVSDGYIGVGYSRDNQDTAQVSLVKVGENGNFLWYKSFGGSRTDRAHSIIATSEGDLLIAGYANSNNGDVPGNHNPVGNSDAWLIKTNSVGGIIWSKSLGGSGADTAYSVIQGTSGYLIAGSATSADGDLTGNFGATDGWVVQTDDLGNIIWQRNLGGGGNDVFRQAVANADGTFTVVGTTYSSNAASNGNKGGCDVWVVKISSTGLPIWSKTFGGSASDHGFGITRTQDNGYLISGTSNSSNGDLSGAIGVYDSWLIKIDGEGELVWQKRLGTTKEDFLFGALYHDENEFTVAGMTQPVNPSDHSDGYLARLGNTSTVKGTITAPSSFSGALITAVKTGFERATALSNNQYSMDLNLGSYTLKLELQNPYYTVTPSSVPVNFSGYFLTTTADFTVQPIPGQQDLSIDIIPLSIPRPGFEQQYKIVYRNIGTTTIASGQVSFIKDSKLDFVSANPLVSSQTGHTLTWNYSNLQPFDSTTIILTLKIQPPPTVSIGDTLSSYAIIDPVSSDQTPADDTSILRQLVVGSYDPNDKTGSWGGFMAMQKVMTTPYINYLIRFQNTGTDTAFTVHVRDTLDTRLDWTSFEMLAASHSYNLAITGKNKLDWKFTDIKLVDSNRNEPASHGYIAYRLKTKNSIPAGDTIHNTASIYFDYNLPVITNNAFTRIVNQNVVLPLTLLDFRAGYQNPDAVLFWQTAQEYDFDRFEVERSSDAVHFEKLAIVASQQSSSGHYQFREDLSLRSGTHFYYRLKMVDLDGSFKYSKTQLVKRSEVTSIELLVSPNPLYGGVGRAYISLPNASQVQLNVIDLRGRVMQRQSRQLEKGFNSLQFDMSFLPAGTYILQLVADKKISTARFILLK